MHKFYFVKFELTSFLVLVGLLGCALVLSTMEQRDKNVLVHDLRQRICALQVSVTFSDGLEPHSDHGRDDRMSALRSP